MSRLSSILFASALAFASLGASAAQAQYYQPGPPPPPGYFHHWHHGDRFRGPRDVVRNWDRYRLPPPPYGAYWVHAGPQFLLLGGGGVVLRVWGP